MAERVELNPTEEYFCDTLSAPPLSEKVPVIGCCGWTTHKPDRGTRPFRASFALFIIRPSNFLLRPPFISYHILTRLGLATFAYNHHHRLDDFHAPRTLEHGTWQECVRLSTSLSVCCPPRRRRLRSFHEPRIEYTTLPSRGARDWRETSAQFSTMS